MLINYSFTAIAAAMFIVSGSVQAAPTAAPASADVATAPVTNANPADDQKVICKKTPVTGTRFASQQCHTKAEWTAMTAEARAFTNKATTGPCTLGCSGH